MRKPVQRIKSKVIITVARMLPKRYEKQLLTGLMDDPDALHRFWRQPSPEGNDPNEYIFPVARSRSLLSLLNDLPAGSRILEVGCNVGRNLAHLKDAGYEVAGIEISPHAVELLRVTYPQLAQSHIYVGPAEEVLPSIPDDSFDLVFTMAVIEHIHPDSTVVFDRMVKVAPQMLTIEPAGWATHRQYPHDVPGLFVQRGMRVLAQTPMSEFPELVGDPLQLSGYTAHRFVRAENREGSLAE